MHCLLSIPRQLRSRIVQADCNAPLPCSVVSIGAVSTVFCSKIPWYVVFRCESVHEIDKSHRTLLDVIGAHVLVWFRTSKVYRLRSANLPFWNHLANWHSRDGSLMRIGPATLYDSREPHRNKMTQNGHDWFADLPSVCPGITQWQPLKSEENL